MFPNQLRTLILNVSGTNNPGINSPGEEYVPANYVAQTLPTYLSNVRGLFFGANPTRLTLNLVLRQMLGFIHTTELDEFVTDIDPRITYLPFSSNLFNNTITSYPSFASVLQQVRDGLTSDLVAALFNGGTVEPFRTFQNLWLLHPSLPYKVAGVFLALGYQINALSSQ